ncbi:MAG TPA: hypothetical protein VK808_07495 [Bacteroidia bacterium]|jgi:hypothetical protein|nr:hypothetical protein [Bacteroidia bacterium]
MKKLIALMLVASFTGAVIAQQAPTQTRPAGPMPTAQADPNHKDDKDKKHHRHHHHRHHEKAAQATK